MKKLLQLLKGVFAGGDAFKRPRKVTATQPPSDYSFDPLKKKVSKRNVRQGVAGKANHNRR